MQGVFLMLVFFSYENEEIFFIYKLKYNLICIYRGFNINLRLKLCCESASRRGD